MNKNNDNDIIIWHDIWNIDNEKMTLINNMTRKWKKRIKVIRNKW